MRLHVYLIVLLVLSLGQPASAEEFFLKDGRMVVAAYVGEANGVITILDGAGQRTLARGDVDRIRWTPVADVALRRKAAARRKRFHRARVKQARRLVKSYTHAKSEARASIAAELQRFAELERIPVFADVIASRHEAVRNLALQQLEQMDRIEAVAPLVLGAVGIRDRVFTDRAHAAAIRTSPELTQLLYEYAAAIPMHADARVNALDRLGLMRRADSALSLITTLYHLGLEAEVQHAKVQGFRRKPMNLGNTQLTVELPVVTYFKTSASIRYPATALTRMQNAAVAALEKISGERLGTDVAAWQAWWKEEQASRRKKVGG